MSLQACADIVQRGDPDRFAAAMAAAPAARAILFPIYALNVEAARAPWVTQEPMIAEMRLQWWRDVLEEIRTGAQVRRHEVATPLAAVLDPDGTRILDRAIDARRRDIHAEPFDDEAALWDHLDATAGGVMWASARALGALAEHEPVIRRAARAAGLANWFLAIPEYEARGRQPLPDGRPGAVQSLARAALEDLATARRSRHGIPPEVRPALYPAALAAPVLSRAAGDPGRVAAAAIAPSEARRRLILARLAMTGRW